MVVTGMDTGFSEAVERALAAAPASANGVLVIRLPALRRNYRRAAEASLKAETAAVVKANAYGLGIQPVLTALQKETARTFFVATLDEALALRTFANDATIYTLNGLMPGTSAVYRDARLRPVLNSLAEVEEWSAYCREHEARLPAAIQFDTGMCRVGLEPEAADALAEKPELLQPFRPAVLMSHLVRADEPMHPLNEVQFKRFEAVTSLFPGIAKSLVNSAGCLLRRKYHLDLARPGIAIYGGNPQKVEPSQFEPVVWLFGRIVQVRHGEKGFTVGYGGTETLRRDSRIATVGVGYADGYFRGVSSSDAKPGAVGHIGEHALPLIGRVSMDLTTFDATDVPEALVHRGGFVELLGEKTTVDDLARHAGTIGYEVLTSLGRRYHRVYVDE
ncbi:alanine racemase [Rhodomicrobium vannielii]|nr:alanine racemase [Rhodomicrobium vannielii]